MQEYKEHIVTFTSRTSEHNFRASLFSVLCFNHSQSWGNIKIKCNCLAVRKLAHCGSENIKLKSGVFCRNSRYKNCVLISFYNIENKHFYVKSQQRWTFSTCLHELKLQKIKKGSRYEKKKKKIQQSGNWQINY